MLGRLHKLLGENMKYTSNVGATHYAENSMGPDFIRERSAMFFAPGHIQKRHADWGPGEFEKRADAFWRAGALKSRDWLSFETGSGGDAVDAGWREVLAGKTPPNKAWVVGF